ncbi:MAG: DMT family transporter [Cyclobacteriaceae bacterium]
MSIKTRLSPFGIGVTLALVAAACFSLKAIFVKLSYRDAGIAPVPLLALRMAFAMPFFVLFSWKKTDGQPNISQLQWVWVVVLGLLGYYISSLLDFLGLQYITAALERMILYLYPTIVLFINALIKWEKPSRVQWIAVVVTYIGLAIAFFDPSTIALWSADQWTGAALVFACSFTFACYIVGSGKLIPLVGPSKFTSVAMTAASLGVLAHFALLDSTPFANLSQTAYAYGLLIAIFSTVIPSYLVSESIRRIGSDNVAIVGSVGPVVTIFQAHWLLNEPITWQQVVGTLVIILGVMLLARKGHA